VKLTSVAWVSAAVICGASIAVVTARATTETPPDLKLMVPTAFGDWAEASDHGAQVVDPLTKETLDKIWSQVLTRTYVNKDGYRIMLSMAYGGDHQAHRPEICYPAKGFMLGTVQDGPLPTPFGDIKVRRLTANLGARNEPVTYWVAMADHVVRNQFDKRMVQIRLFLTGQIPDGLLFRISSIDKDPERAFAMQQKFTADMLAAVPPATRRQLSGLESPAAAT